MKDHLEIKLIQIVGLVNVFIAEVLISTMFVFV